MNINLQARMKLAFLPSPGHNRSTPLMGKRFMVFLRQMSIITIKFIKRRREEKPVALLIVVVELGSIRFFIGKAETIRNE